MLGASTKAMKRSAIRQISRRPSKSLEAQADKLWSEYIKIRGRGICQVPGCFKVGTDAHHIFTRSIKHLRHEPANGILLCAGHHVFCIQSAHKNPEWFRGVLIGLMGEKRYEALCMNANLLRKPDYKLATMELKELLRGMK